jgi:hypothetical protein
MGYHASNMIGILKRRIAKAAETTPGGQDTTRWVVIAIVGWAEAEVMRSKLESEGIPCVLQREAAGAAYGITIGPLGEVRVLVPEALAEQALDILGAEPEDDSGEVSDEEREVSDKDEDEQPSG